VRVDLLTIFPDLFESPLRQSLLGKAIGAGLVDDTAYGGGPGMVMAAEPIFDAVESLGSGERRLLLLSPAGRRLDQALVRELADEQWLVMICGRYEGVDERVVDGLEAEEISIGDYVLSGGEVPALVLLEAVSRLVPGVIGNAESLEGESFELEGLLDHPHYTRPREFRGMEVPEVLLSGNHAAIEAWRRDSAERKTRRNRPDLTPGHPGHPPGAPPASADR
jgi:tRNA (guanine37-N1)-methyltransferase